MAKLWCCTSVLWFLYVCSRHCLCLCPEGFSGFREVFICLQNITHGLNDTNVLAGTTTETIRHYCQDGTFNETVNCLTGLYNDCKHQRGQELLRQIATPHVWQQGVQGICGNLNEHAQFSECIAKQRQGIYSCLQYNDNMFMREMEQSGDWHRTTFTVCRYYTGMRICTGRQVKDKCNMDVGNLLENYIAAITPLLCNESASKRNCSSMPRENHYLIIISTVVASTLFLSRSLTKT